jgi:hypothetical protein
MEPVSEIDYLIYKWRVLGMKTDDAGVPHHGLRGNFNRPQRDPASDLFHERAEVVVGSNRVFRTVHEGRAGGDPLKKLDGIADEGGVGIDECDRLTELAEDSSQRERLESMVETPVIAPEIDVVCGEFDVVDWESVDYAGLIGEHGDLHLRTLRTETTQSG